MILTLGVWQLFKYIVILTLWSHIQFQGWKKVVGKNETVASYRQCSYVILILAPIQRGRSLFANEVDQNVTWPFLEMRQSRESLTMTSTRVPLRQLVKQRQLPAVLVMPKAPVVTREHPPQQRNSKRSSKTLGELVIIRKYLWVFSENFQKYILLAEEMKLLIYYSNLSPFVSTVQ